MSSAERSASEFVSGREACDLLAGVGLDRETARRVLKANLAGAGHALRGTTLYERARVVALLTEPVDDRLLAPVCRRGMFVARLGHGADVSAPAGEQLLAASGPWRLSQLARLRLRSWIEREPPVPFLATVGGFVVLGADLLEVTAMGAVAPPTAGGRPRQEPCLLTLGEPGSWFEDLRGRRFPTGPGGPWLMWPSGMWGPHGPQLGSTA